MATWVRSFTADKIGGTDDDLSGPADLDNDTAPGDFDPAGVTSVRFQFTLSHTGTFDAGGGSDSYTLAGTVEIETTGDTQLADIATGGGTLDDTTATIVVDVTDNAPNVAASVADWEGARFAAVSGIIATFAQSKGPDGTAAQILAASVTITITYTPGAVVVDLAGSGGNAAAGTGTLEVLRRLTGAGPVASSGRGALTRLRELTGAGAAASAGRGDLFTRAKIGYAELSGTQRFETDQTEGAGTGDADAYWIVKLPSWSGASEVEYLGGRWGAAGQQSWFVKVTRTATGPAIQVAIVDTGGTASFHSTGAITGLSDDTWYGIRVRVDIDNGASQSIAEITFKPLTETDLATSDPATLNWEVYDERRSPAGSFGAMTARADPAETWCVGTREDGRTTETLQGEVAYFSWWDGWATGGTQRVELDLRVRSLESDDRGDAIVAAMTWQGISGPITYQPNINDPGKARTGYLSNATGLRLRADGNPSAIDPSVQTPDVLDMRVDVQPTGTWDATFSLLAKNIRPQIETSPGNDDFVVRARDQFIVNAGDLLTAWGTGTRRQVRAVVDYAAGDIHLYWRDPSVHDLELSDDTNWTQTAEPHPSDTFTAGTEIATTDPWTIAAEPGGSAPFTGDVFEMLIAFDDVVVASFDGNRSDARDGYTDAQGITWTEYGTYLVGGEPDPASGAWADYTKVGTGGGAFVSLSGAGAAASAGRGVLEVVKALTGSGAASATAAAALERLRALNGSGPATSDGRGTLDAVVTLTGSGSNANASTAAMTRLRGLMSRPWWQGALDAYLDTTDHFGITGDVLDVRCLVAIDWATVSSSDTIGMLVRSGDDLAAGDWYLALDETGQQLRFSVGSFVHSQTVPAPLSHGGLYWVRGLYDRTDPAGRFRLYFRRPVDGSWTEFGTPNTTDEGAVTAVSSRLTIGAAINLSSQIVLEADGVAIYRVEVHDATTMRVYMNPNRIGQPAATGETWARVGAGDTLTRVVHSGNANDGTGNTVRVRGLAGAGPAAADGAGLLTALVELTGAGPASSTGRGALEVIRLLTGSGGNAATAAAALNRLRDLTGAGASSAAGRGAITVLVPMAGAGPNASTGRGALTAVLALTGSGPNASDGTGTLSVLGAIDLSGAGAASSNGHGDITRTRGLTGAGPNAASSAAALQVLRALAGAGPSASDGRGILATLGLIDLAGAGAAVSAGRGVAEILRTLTGAGSVASAGSGILDVTRLLTGAGSNAVSGFGTVEVLRRLVGAGGNAATAAAILGVLRDLTGSGAAAADGTGTVEVLGLIDLTGSGAAASSGHGVVAPRRNLSGAGGNAAAASALLEVLRLLTGAGGNASDGRGAVDILGTVDLTGAGPNASRGAGSLSVLRDLIGAGPAANAGIGLLSVARGLSGAGNAANHGTGAIVVLVGLAGTGAGVSAGQGALEMTRTLAGAGAAAAAGFGFVDVTKLLAGAGANVSAGTGVLGVLVATIQPVTQALTGTDPSRDLFGPDPAATIEQVDPARRITHQLETTL